MKAVIARRVVLSHAGQQRVGGAPPKRRALSLTFWTELMAEHTCIHQNRFESHWLGLKDSHVKLELAIQLHCEVANAGGPA